MAELISATVDYDLAAKASVEPAAIDRLLIEQDKALCELAAEVEGLIHRLEPVSLSDADSEPTGPQDSPRLSLVASRIYDNTSQIRRLSRQVRVAKSELEV